MPLGNFKLFQQCQPLFLGQPFQSQPFQGQLFQRQLIQRVAVLKDSLFKGQLFQRQPFQRVAVLELADLQLAVLEIADLKHRPAHTSRLVLVRFWLFFFHFFLSLSRKLDYLDFVSLDSCRIWQYRLWTFKIQNQKDFCLKINIPRGNYCSDELSKIGHHFINKWRKKLI